MRFAVVGAGAIGAYLGAALARGGSDVALIARGAHLAEMRRNGVSVQSARGDFHVDVPATDDPAEIGTVDCVILGVKARDYAEIGPLVQPLLADDTAIVPAQNGVPWWYFHGERGPYEGRRVESVDPGGAVTEVLDPARVIGCVVYCSTELVAPGVIRHVEGTRFSIGEPAGGPSTRCTQLSEAIVAGGLKSPVVEDVRTELWLKLMGNAAFNPVSALTRATMERIATFAPTRELVRGIMTETLEVATRLGHRPEVSLERRLEGAARVGDHRTSMLQDFDAHKPLELAPLVGAVLELAELTDTPTPTLRAVGAVVTLLDRSNRDAAY